MIEIAEKLNTELFDRYELTEVYSAEKIAVLNKIQNPDRIHAGQELNIDPVDYIWDRFFEIRKIQVSPTEIAFLPPTDPSDYMPGSSEVKSMTENIENITLGKFTQKMAYKMWPGSYWHKVKQEADNMVTVTSFGRSAENPIEKDKQIEIYTDALRKFYYMTGAFPKKRWAEEK